MAKPKNIVLAVVLMLCTASPLAAQGPCTARPAEYRNASTAEDAGHVWGEEVPVGERWVIRAAGVGSQAWNQAEYMMEIAHPVPVAMGGPGWWYVPVARSAGKPDGTPVLALDRELTLLAGERLGARANGLNEGTSIALFYLYWRLPASCTTISGYAER